MAPSTPPNHQSEPGKFHPVLVGGASVTMKPKSKKDLGVEFDVHPQTIGDWCKHIGIDTAGKKLTIPQIMQFYGHYGWPGNYQVQLRISE